MQLGREKGKAKKKKADVYRCCLHRSVGWCGCRDTSRLLGSAAAVQREELNWTSDLLSGAFWTQYIADLTVTEGFYRAVMQWVSVGAGLGAGTDPVTALSLPTPVLGFATEEKEKKQKCLEAMTLLISPGLMQLMHGGRVLIMSNAATIKTAL